MTTIRNFCIIAHIDHGKSTLADRMLELTKTIEPRKMREQVLDQMDLERERGITIKLQPVQMRLTISGNDYQFNLIDTPGHADFSYEVSRTLSAVEGAILLVDASQGIEAQTVSNLYLAVSEKLTLIPVLNKIDLPHADVPRVRRDLAQLLGVPETEILAVSGKTGQGVSELFQAIVDRIPPPAVAAAKPLRALIFDSRFDEYRGVIADIRMVDGSVKAGQPIRFVGSGANGTVIEVGRFSPALTPQAELAAGEIGYVVTGLKRLQDCRVGDTMSVVNASVTPVPGYAEIKPMVYAGVYPASGDDYPRLQTAMGKLQLNDASLTYVSEQSPALGFGFRAGFLGLLHMEIVQERLRREFGLEIVMTVPSVVYRVHTGDGRVTDIASPSQLPDPSTITSIEQPWVKLDIVSPASAIGGISRLLDDNGAEGYDIEYLDPERVIIHTAMPLVRILVDFYDNLKSASAGYASMSYEFTSYRPDDLVRLDIHVADDTVEAMASIVPRREAYARARAIVERLERLIPRQQFVVKIQAAIGGKIIAAAKLAALRKDVTAKLYGGDVTRKRKLLAKQKKGKQRMLSAGTVELPQSAYLAVFRSGQDNRRDS